MFNFWYTDLTQDSGTPWFSTHLYAGTRRNGNPIYGVDQTASSLRFWRLKLLIGLAHTIMVEALKFI
jgi:hypothetical protein